MPARPPSLKQRALQWLAQREHSRSELRAKLLRRARASAEVVTAVPGGADNAACGDADHDVVPPVHLAGTVPGAAADEVDALLDWLELHRYLSPDRFVESRVNARQGRWGNLRIVRELAQHGLGLDAQAAQALSESELDRARAVWRKKYGQPAVDAAGRLRQMRFLSGRGFSAEVIRRVVRGGDEHDDSA